MAKHRRKKLLARAARADGFSVSTASSPGLFGPQPIPRKAESDDDDESDAGAPAAAPAAASPASGGGKGSKYYQPTQNTLQVGCPSPVRPHAHPPWRSPPVLFASCRCQLPGEEVARHRLDGQRTDGRPVHAGDLSCSYPHTLRWSR